MENTVVTEGKLKMNRRRRRWYNSYIFPLVPVLTTRQGDKYNTWGFTFHWMFLKVWSLDSFCFELACVADQHWGIGVTAIVPYLRMVFTIPCPSFFDAVFRKLDRKPS